MTFEKFPRMPIDAVILDYGCVLSQAPSPADFEPLHRASGVDSAVFHKAYWRHRDAYDLDELDPVGYWQMFGKDAHVNFSAEQIHQLCALDCQIWQKTDPGMVEWVRLLRAEGTKTAIISNLARNLSGYLRRTAHWIDLFHHLCFSGELGMMKPHPEIFHACLEALCVPAPRALFVDDREPNVAAARALGLHAVLFRSPEQLQGDLHPYGLAESLANAQARASLCG